MDHRRQMCYLNASQVQSPVGDLSGVRLRTADDGVLGKLDGIVIDPAERRLLYFVVESPGWLTRRRFLVSADMVRVEPDRSLTLDVQREELTQCEEFDTEEVRNFSEEDALTAMFARHVA